MNSSGARGHLVPGGRVANPRAASSPLNCLAIQLVTMILQRVPDIHADIFRWPADDIRILAGERYAFMTRRRMPALWRPEATQRVGAVAPAAGRIWSRSNFSRSSSTIFSICARFRPVKGSAWSTEVKQPFCSY